VGMAPPEVLLLVPTTVRKRDASLSVLLLQVAIVSLLLVVVPLMIVTAVPVVVPLVLASVVIVRCRGLRGAEPGRARLSD